MAICAEADITYHVPHMFFCLGVYFFFFGPPGQGLTSNFVQ
jgi:hypothetical protein